MNEEKKPNTVRAYCLGGLGFNVGAQLENFRNHQLPATASLDIAYADTSDSDMHPETSIDNCYFLPEAAGSGKFQGQHVEAIEAHTKPFLRQFKPSDTLNIIIASASGGSGPAWANNVLYELLEGGYNAIVIVVGTTADKRETGNTFNNIQSYMNVAENTGKSVPMAYFQNSPETPSKEVDGVIITLVGALCVLFSGMNHGLDKQDLYNFLHFNENKTTSYPARLVQFCMFNGDNHINDIGNVISVATLTNGRTGHEISQTPEYQVVGRIPADATQIVIDKAPIHFVNSTGRFNQILKSLQGKLDDMNNARQALIENTVVPVTKGNKRGLITG